jgi:outer membrane protein TolC
MRRKRAGSFLACGVVLLFGLAGGLLAQADEPGAEWQPITFAEDSISLTDAIRITLDNSPVVALERENTRLQWGILQQASGAFDATFIGSLSYQEERNALTEAGKASQRKTRDELRDELDETEQALAATQTGLDQLLVLQADPTGSRLDDPLLQAIVDLFNTSISAAPSAAERRELIRERDEAIAEAIGDQTLRIAEFEADLDEITGELENLGEAPDEEESWDTFVNLEIANPTRRGFTLGTFFEYTGEGNNFVDKPIEAEFGGKGIEDFYRASVGFTFDTPLARGLGLASAGAFEQSADLDHQASLATLKHVVASSVLTTAIAYWDALAAMKVVEIREQSAQLQSELREQTEALIRGDELPRTELARVEAAEAEAFAALDAAKRTADQARIRLALVMGLAVADESQAPRPEDDFPAEADVVNGSAAYIASLLTAALEHRDDYRAARLLEESGTVLTTAARIDLKPKIDLASKLWWNALGEGSASEPFSADVVGPSYNLALSFEVPFANNVQQGLLMQARANSRSRSILAEDLGRAIRSRIVEAVGSLAATSEQLRFSTDAVASYQSSLDAEIEKFRAGVATLIDTLLTEQRLTESRLGEISARQQYARFLAEIAFETGALVSGDEGEVWRVEEVSLLRMPDAGETGEGVVQ